MVAAQPHRNRNRHHLAAYAAHQQPLITSSVFRVLCLCCCCCCLPSKKHSLGQIESCSYKTHPPQTGRLTDRKTDTRRSSSNSLIRLVLNFSLLFPPFLQQWSLLFPTTIDVSYRVESTLLFYIFFACASANYAYTIIIGIWH